MRKFVITGCGNSGTLFTARLLTKLGARTAHEEFFTAFTPPVAVRDYHWWLNNSATVGEVSSLAAPFLARLPENTLIFHQVRNPVAVIRSLMGRKTFDPGLGMRHLPNLRFFFRHLPQADHDDEPIVLAMKYWLYWNRLVADRAHDFFVTRVRVEDLNAETPRHTERLLRSIGLVEPFLDDDDTLAALQKYGSTYHGGARDEGVIWASLPEGALKAQIAVDAGDYGYSPQDLEAA
jgi:hypothetical protein